MHYINITLTLYFQNVLNHPHINLKFSPYTMYIHLEIFPYIYTLLCSYIICPLGLFNSHFYFQINNSGPYLALLLSVTLKGLDGQPSVPFYKKAKLFCKMAQNRWRPGSADPGSALGLAALEKNLKIKKPCLYPLPPPCLPY